MIRYEGKCLHIEGPMDIESVPALMEEGAAHVRNGAEIVDFAAVTEVDSSAVAFALALLGEALAAGRTLAFANLPPAMTNLAQLYGVADFIPIVRT